MSRISSLVVRNLTHSFGANTVLDDVSFSVGPGHRLGIIGPNGVGKSTLLRIIAGLVPPESGKVTTSPAASTIGYLSQESDRIAGETVQEYLLRRTGWAEASTALNAASGLLAQGAPGADDAYSNALDDYLTLGAADFDARIGEVLAEVRLPARLTTLPMNALSGGQSARVGLAALLLSKFDLYLL